MHAVALKWEGETSMAFKLSHYPQALGCDLAVTVWYHRRITIKGRSMPLPGLYVFDAYGTLFDVHSAAAAHRATIGEIGRAHV